ncbi:MAG: aminopeptidase P family protein [Clostridia bacterium]|nr:aminopeptidase P family protein [Clostridia bacterium]
MNHLNKIAEKLPEYGLDAMLITSAPGEFYAVGFHGEGVAVVTPNKTWYYTDTRYIEAAGALITGAEIAIAPAGQNYKTLTQAIVEDCAIKKLGIEDAYMSVGNFWAWEKALTAQMIPASKLLEELRMVKDEEELAAMREAQRITDETFTAILDFIKPGVTEQEIGARLQYEMLSRGAERMSFDPIVASGPNGSKPHAIPSEKKVQNGEFITMDFGCVYGGYCSDMTRTVALGEPSDEMRKVYDIVYRAQQAGIAAVKGGVVGADVHEAGRKVIADGGYGDYFGHGFGHSLGIEIHEDPRFSPSCHLNIPSRATLSAEPGIYLPGKFGVRIEDVVVLTDNGCEDITKSPKELIIL